MEKQKTVEEAIACRMLGDMRALESTELKLAVSGTVNMLLLKAWQKEKAEQALDRWNKMGPREGSDAFRAKAEKRKRGGGRPWPSHSVTGPKGLTYNPFEGVLGKLKEKTG